MATMSQGKFKGKKEILVERENGDGNKNQSLCDVSRTGRN